MKKVLLVLCVLCMTFVNARAQETSSVKDDEVSSIRILDKQEGNE